ncbi:substrate-binding domain-containing protein [Donghicola mangrovi]|uniref:Transporter substrate-binding domain-containing protein n=1 Tax=Donghicola mangrovi TaxID=2729614 RepID=A0A850QAU1_9RHOB|nr:substrate-binding domain-containing protein [Donghicola mangrovi]NVO24068.1 transporter substrate-binding domain-containing protein [Donghicola mangrovi]
MFKTISSGFAYSVAFALMTSTSAVAQDSLTFATSQPYGLISGSELPDGGVGTLVFKHIMDKAGLNAAVEFAPSWTDAEEGARKADYAGTFPFYYTLARSLSFRYSDAVLAVGERLYANDVRLSSLDDLAGKDVCYPEGYDLATSLQLRVDAGDFSRVFAPDMNACFQKLANKEVFAVLADQSEAGFVLNFADYDVAAVRESNFDLARRTLHLMIPFDYPNAADIITKFNTALTEARDSGELEQMLKDRIDVDLIPLSATDFRVKAGVDAVLKLHDGSRQKGRVLESAPGRYDVDTQYGPITYPRSIIADICPAEGCPGDAAPAVAAAPAANVAEQVAEAVAETVVETPAEPEVVASVAPTALRLQGSNTVGAQLAPALLEAWVAKEGAEMGAWALGEENERSVEVEGELPGGVKEITLAAHGSSTGFRAMIEGNADIAMASRRIKDEERNDLLTAGYEDPLADGEKGEVVVGLDGVAVIVHPDNQIRELTIEQLRAIFAGQITNWSQLGGEDLPIVVHSRDDKSGTYDTFESLVMNKLPIVGSAKLFESNANLSDAVRAEKGAIGFTGLSYVRNARALPLKVCDAVHSPTGFSVKTEEYPLSRRLYMYTNTKVDPVDVKSFTDYVVTEGQKQVEESGFVNLEVGTRKGWEAVDALANIQFMAHQNGPVVRDYVLTVRDMERLSTTFHFITGKSDLDARSIDDMGRLAEWMAQPENAGRKLVFVGFADNRGGYEINLQISQQRAQAVADNFLAQSTVKPEIKVMAVGEDAPVACNDETGYDQNRRVEVWVSR